MGFITEAADITIPYSEMEDSPHIEATRDSIEVVRKLKCPWADRWQLIRELCGYSEIRDGNVVVHFPHHHKPADFEDLRRVVVQRASAKGFSPIKADTQQFMKYNNAIVTVRYATPDYAELEERGENEPSETLISESIEPATQFLTLSNRELFWADGKQIQNNESPALLLRMYDWVYTMYRQPTIPWAVMDLVGYTNNAAVTSKELGKTWPAGTLLCGNPSPRREVTAFGENAWTIAFHFTYNEKGWNFWPRTDKVDSEALIIWEEICNSELNPIKFHPPANFGNLVL